MRHPLVKFVNERKAISLGRLLDNKKSIVVRGQLPYQLDRKVK